jgi:FkbM family methyltransferase
MRHLGVQVTDIRAGAAVVSRKPYDVQPIVSGKAYLATLRRRGEQARVVRLGSDISLVATGKRASDVRAEKAGAGWWVGATGGDEKVQILPVTTRGWLAAKSDPSPRAVTLFENDAMHVLGMRHVAWLLDRYKVDCVLDVGANVGQFAKELRRSGFGGQIISFEPVPAFVERLAKQAAGDSGWTVHQLALGSTEGVVPLRVQRTFSSLLNASEYGKRRFGTLRQGAAEEHIIEVPLRRLDAVLDDLLPDAGDGPRRLFLKMDTQGFDVEVFRGLGDKVAEVIGLQSELGLLPIYESMPRMPEALALYEASGFEISGLYPVTSEPDGRVIEYDCVMVRADSCPS